MLTGVIRKRQRPDVEVRSRTDRTGSRVTGSLSGQTYVLAQYLDPVSDRTLTEWSSGCFYAWNALIKEKTKRNKRVFAGVSQLTTSSHQLMWTGSECIVSLIIPPTAIVVWNRLASFKFDWFHFILTPISQHIRQPHSVHSSPGSPHPVHIISPHHSHQLNSLSSSVTPSTFHSRLKTLSQILSSIVILIPFGLPSRILNLYWTELGTGVCLF